MFQLALDILTAPVTQVIWLIIIVVIVSFILWDYIKIKLLIRGAFEFIAYLQKKLELKDKKEQIEKEKYMREIWKLEECFKGLFKKK